jgi:hypothetical protein
MMTIMIMAFTLTMTTMINYDNYKWNHCLCGWQWRRWRRLWWCTMYMYITEIIIMIMTTLIPMKMLMLIIFPAKKNYWSGVLLWQNQVACQVHILNDPPCRVSVSGGGGGGGVRYVKMWGLEQEGPTAWNQVFHVDGGIIHKTRPRQMFPALTHTHAYSEPWTPPYCTL